MTVELLPYDSADHFRSSEDQALLLDDALESGDDRYIRHALSVIARARGMSQLEQDTGIKRQALYRALGPGGNPTLATLVKVVNALGMRLRVETKQAA